MILTFRTKFRSDNFIFKVKQSITNDIHAAEKIRFRIKLLMNKKIRNLIENLVLSNNNDEPVI